MATTIAVEGPVMAADLPPPVEAPAVSTVNLLVTPRDAAKALCICQKTLWSLTKRGDLPVVRIGRAVRYDDADLHRYIQHAKGRAKPNE